MSPLSPAVRRVRAQTNQPRGLFYTLARMMAAQRQRNALSTLDEQQLQDVGLNQQDAQKEAARPAWDLPENP